MRGYVKKISRKAAKLSKEQLLDVLSIVCDENENLYSILDSVSTGLLIVDNDFIIRQSNSILESCIEFNTHVDDAINSGTPVWEYIVDEDISKFFKKCKNKQITNSSEDFSFTNASGNIRFVSIVMQPFVHDGVLKGRIFLIRDITESKNQQIVLQRMENLANLTNLAAGMAHEIKNPLGAISIHIQLIQKALEKARNNNDILPPKKFVEDHIDVVNEEIEHLNSLVMDFLLAVRPVNAKLELKDPAILIENFVTFLEPEFAKNKIRVVFNKANNTQKIMMDEKLLREVIVNLAQNSLAAIKSKFPECNDEEDFATEDFPGLFTIEIALVENKYIIRVSDNGCGMSPETVSKIFEPYFTTKATGTGLGMTTVYKIIKEFSGEITVHSEENKGTSFTIVLPLHQDNRKLLAQSK